MQENFNSQENKEVKISPKVKEYSYKNLLLQQDYLRQEFAGKIAKPNPDHKVYPEDNDWKGGTEADRKKWLDNQ